MRLDKKLQPKPDEIKAKANVTKAEVADAEAREENAPDAGAVPTEQQSLEDAAAGLEPGSPEAVKAKMRAALDRKGAQAHGGERGTSAAQKNHGVAGPVGPKRFQRKSGG